MSVHKNTLLYRLYSLAGFLLILTGGKIFGIRVVIKYLRNPNPWNTVKLLRAFGAKIGDGATFKNSIFLDNVYEDKDSTGDFSNLEIGEKCYIGDCVYFDLASKIIMENNSILSGKVSILTHADCNRSPVLNNVYPRQTGKVVIGEGAWIGFGTIVKHGVTVGKNSVVSAGTFLTKNVPEGMLAFGNRAEIKKKIV